MQKKRPEADEIREVSLRLLYCSKKTPGCAGGSGSFKLWLSILFFIEVKEMLPGIMIEVAGNRIRN
ncbi:hypothetical protein, partial [Pyramidobacter piscolens]|uniref:hypothetical protein n=1 Tax=Pyramidobacter piscolens TaxID=638849 RepID=UPI0033293A08